jgi:DNA-binding transcriptional MerR regulator
VASADLTIDELARRTGMTVRNIRAHQSRGLVPAPEVRGRTGFYGQAHLDRIEVIKELQGQGFNLEAIRRLLEGSEGSPEDVLRFTQKVAEPFHSEVPQQLDLAELASRWGDYASPGLLERAVGLGLLRQLDDGRIEELSPRLGRAGRDLVELGIDPGTGIDVIETVKDHVRAVADAYVELFLEEIWRPFEAAGRPADRWQEVYEALERLRPLAGEAVLAMFQLEMTRATQAALGAEVERLRDGV